MPCRTQVAISRSVSRGTPRPLGDERVRLRRSWPVEAPYGHEVALCAQRWRLGWRWPQHAGRWYAVRCCERRRARPWIAARELRSRNVRPVSRVQRVAALSEATGRKMRTASARWSVASGRGRAESVERVTREQRSSHHRRSQSGDRAPESGADVERSFAQGPRWESARVNGRGWDIGWPTALCST
jgi:hypothetical protein